MCKELPKVTNLASEFEIRIPASTMSDILKNKKRYINFDSSNEYKEALHLCYRDKRSKNLPECNKIAIILKKIFITCFILKFPKQDNLEQSSYGNHSGTLFVSVATLLIVPCKLGKVNSKKNPSHPFKGLCMAIEYLIIPSCVDVHSLLNALDFPYQQLTLIGLIKLETD
ncbi:hypothetical protein BpHYR1_014988 [Brachionus plicatilis]|uniref:Uncharacterized protein n=1 Tax=Brachionus plicatilis TaxID=10195 RepID=A0A3M7RL60_BRAPC|nr:hypothetical protein BpHYR1_014988 [Brachionus plicatilis]